MPKSGPDPTKNPKFKKVVYHFLKTPPRKHEAEKKGKPQKRTPKTKSS